MRRLVGSATISTSPRMPDLTGFGTSWPRSPDSLWETGIRFGTVGLQLGQWQLEVTTYRADSYDPGHASPSLRLGKTSPRIWSVATSP